MNYRLIFILFLFLSNSLFSLSKTIDIERFEHIDTRKGMSQNNVLSIFCDHNGFMWFGTMDGLNRYDGYSFKIYKSESGISNILTNNRISRIWEDKNNYLWIKTYDGYYHYLIRETDEFITFPNYRKSIEEKNSVISCFYEDNSGNIFLGSTNSGFYHLKLNKKDKQYNSKQFLLNEKSPENSNTINFIEAADERRIWIGTKEGLYLYDCNSEELEKIRQGNNFSKAVSFNNKTYLGLDSGEILIYDFSKNNFSDIPVQLNIPGIEKLNFLISSNDNLLIGTFNEGLIVYQSENNKTYQFKKYGSDAQQAFIDSYGLIWIKTNEFGIVKIDLRRNEEKHFDLIEKEKLTIIDDERPYIYEDMSRNVWIGIHGGGLAQYDRENDNFKFYRNDPLLNNTLSSDFVHCITEDKSGLLWIGTGQFNGGANKVILSNPSFRHIKPEGNIKNLADNVVRSIFEDSNNKIWIATKSGSIYIYNSDFTLLRTVNNFHLTQSDIPGYNVYSIIEDNNGYIWMGTKGGGVFVSKNSIKSDFNFYKNLSFYQYKNEYNDPSSLSNNNIYSLLQDNKSQIWIGTYGGGLNRVINRSNDKLICERITTGNSSLSSNDIRCIKSDSDGKIWIATVFGLNTLENDYAAKKYKILSFFHDPEILTSLNYNDVVHIFEDSKKQLWFGTFGGGVSLLKKYEGQKSEFTNLTIKQGLINDAVFSILEDESGKIWFGTENGISSYLPARMIFENYSINSGLYSENFCENSCCITKDKNVLFGSVSGILLIRPENIEKTQYVPDVYITNFQLNNKDVDIRDSNSPINQNIGLLDNIKLKYNQSSFSFEYAALSYFSPEQNNYAFKLENFEEDWNYVGNQRKATYTNLSPGEYNFMVKASNWDGTWNEIPREIKITITPPWWKSTYALIAYIIITTWVLYFAQRIFLKYYRMQNDLKVERRVNDIKLQFFTNISHEIRTPLTLILGPLDDIKSNQNLPDEVKEKITIMERNGKRMLKLINQLLDFRKIQKKKMDLKIEQINLVSFVSEICEQFLPIANHKNINFEIKSTSPDVNVFIDPNKFDSVIFNILSNAFKYTGDNKSIKVKTGMEDSSHAYVEISDEGSGIPKDKLQFLFQRFTPLSSDDNQLNGTGIGLNLAFEIIKLHKGEILVESEENSGSKFTVRLQTGYDHFKKNEINSISNATHHHRKPVEDDEFFTEIKQVKEKTSKMPIALVVEDNPEVLIYLNDCLKNHFNVVTAINGVEGIEKANLLYPDIIISDVMMPQKDGIQMTTELKADFNTSHIPVIMLTAKSNIDDQIQGIESGAEAYIIKPFNSRYLRAVATNLLLQRETIIKKYRDKTTPENYEAKISNHDDLFLKEIIDIIENHLTEEEFNVEQLINYSKYSRTVLYTKIKGLLGVAPVDLIRQIRLKHAAKLISREGCKISDAAFSSGFNDPKYFRKCFKTFYGISPSDYQKSKSTL